MGIFGKGKSDGLMNVIRCDEPEYLVWKWRPKGQDVNSTSRENSIRFGSSLRVKDGEVAVFFYKQNGKEQDYIEGPFDQFIKTANLPILANIVGMGWGGESPFQAEIYYINLQGNNQVRFGVPYFDVFDPRLPDHGIPTSVKGTITFNITDYKGFIKLNRLINFNHEQFLNQIKSAIIKYIKGIVSNIPSEMGIPAVQMERQILSINDKVTAYLKPRLENDFGVNVKGIDIDSIYIDKENKYYEELRQLTAGNTAKTINAQTDVNIKNLKDTQAINATNIAESLRIQREEAQRAQRLQTESNYMGAHSLDQQTEVLKTGMNNLGQMGNMSGNGQGMNVAGMMTGMAMGSMMGSQMAGMMNNMNQNTHNSSIVPPPIPNIQYHIYLNGNQMGPFNIQEIQQMISNGQVTLKTLVWKQGMPQWENAENILEIRNLFASSNSVTPPPPPVL